MPDTGKTNLKLSAVTPRGRLAETLPVASLLMPGPRWRHHDLKGLNAWTREVLRALGRRRPLRRFIATGHGSGGMPVGEDPDADRDGLALPMVDHEQPSPPGHDGACAPLSGSFADRGSATMAGATHQALQFLWMERVRPAEFRAGRWHLGIPQFRAWRLTGRAVAEASFLGAQPHP